MDDPINLSADEGEEEVGSASAEKPKVAAATSKKGKEAIKVKPESSNNPVKRQRKLTSKVWDYFELITERDVNGNIQCKCKKCGTKYIAESSHGTGNMQRHTKSCEAKNYRDVGQMILQSNMNGFVGSKSGRLDQNEVRELGALAIAQHNLPLQFVEYEVQDGLKELDQAAFKVRESANYCKGGQVRKQKFKHCVQHVGIVSTRKLKQDVPTRWNSTYLMLDSALFYKKALIHLAKTDANYVHCPTSDEWMKMEKICKFLQVFHEVTEKFSGTKYTTSNLYFPNVLKIRLLLNDHMESSDKYLKNMAAKMHLKFDKYWCDFSTIMSIAVVFDPRYKFQVIDWAYKKVYGSSSNVDLDLFKEKLFSLFDEYVAAFSTTSTNNQSSSRAPTNKPVSDPFMTDFDEFSSCEFTSDGKSELQLYLAEPKLPRTDDFNVLDYWKHIRGRYPVVSLMARDILAIPISTVASESAFSIGGRIIDPHRSSLKGETVESLVCIRDWVFNLAPMNPDEENLCKEIVDSADEDEDESISSKSESLQTQQSGLGQA